jgi:hypothetical protein
MSQLYDPVPTVTAAKRPLLGAAIRYLDALDRKPPGGHRNVTCVAELGLTYGKRGARREGE